MALDPSVIRLPDTVAVVTGAAQGIGAATAVALARFGADVAICDRNAAGLQDIATAVRETGRRVFAQELDVRDGPAVTRFLEGARNELGPLGVLVNNAGGTFWSPFLDVRPRGQAALIEENFVSVTHVVREGVPLMNDGGSIVNVTSVEAFRAAPGFAVYAAMKAAIEQLTRSLALELSDRRIRVNCVAPDAIPTPGDAELASRVSGRDNAADGYARYGARVPLGLGVPDDCAGAIVFLASGLSRFMTGTTLPVDGGSSAAAGWTRGPHGTWLP
jgi:NAD(P)-dependent dehydrogenase (short-subunit alcohol dehydrogenase family)